MDKAWLTTANGLSISRLLLLPFLFIALFYWSQWVFLLLYIIIGSTDFFDGLIARRFNQTSELGKSLDSLSDLFFYFASAYFLYTLFPEVIRSNIVYLWFVFGLVFLSFIVSAIKLGRPIMMHTRLLRLGGALVYFLIIFSFFMDTRLMTTLVLTVYLLGFLEVIAIFLIYGRVDRDTQSIWHLYQQNNTTLIH